MSKPRAKIYLETDTLAHAETAKNNIQTRVSGKDIFETHSLGFGEGNESNPNTPWVLAEFRFNSSVDRDDLWEYIKNQIQNHPQVKNWVVRARVSIHLCSHGDAETLDCRSTGYEEFLK